MGAEIRKRKLADVSYHPLLEIVDVNGAIADALDEAVVGGRDVEVVILLQPIRRERRTLPLR